MQPLSPTVRMHNLSELSSSCFDVLVIGGGVTGAGVAVDAVARGYKVALVEKIDFASGTSSKSTKLVHGGIRYLPNFDFALVHEGLVERGIMLQNVPFMVHPLGFVMPIYEGDRHPVGMPFTTPKGIGLGLILDIGLWMYDFMAGRRSIRRHRRLSRQALLKYAPDLVTENLKEAYIYYDGQTNDVRLTMALIRTAAQYGANITNYTEVTSFLKENGKISGVHVRDTLKGEEIDVQARYVVNAAGVFAEQVEELTGSRSQASIEPSKGVHLVFSREDIKIGDAAIVLPETEDKRILFVVPWESRVVFGTTDTGSGDLDHPPATPEDIAYLLKSITRYFKVHLTEENIISVYAGYRPLVKPHSKAGGSTAKISRSHEVLQSPSGLVSIVGGKLTSYRRMAQDTVDVLSRRDGAKPLHPTMSLRLQGSAGWPKAQRELETRGVALGLTPQVIQHLTHSYGSEASVLMDIIAGDASQARLLIEDLHYVYAEVTYACCNEMAMTPYDFLARRTSITLVDRQRGLGIVDEVAALMAKEHGWSFEQQQAMVDAYRTDIQSQIDAEKVQLATM